MRFRAHRWPTRAQRLAGSIALCLSLAEAGSARAACPSRGSEAACFDPDGLWTPAAPARFIAIPASSALTPGSLSLGLDASYLSRPVVLVARSPDPYGRKVLVVDEVVDTAVSASFFPAPHVEVGAVIPAVLYRTGTGRSGVTSQGGPELSATQVRDVRVGAGHDLVLRRRAGTADFRAMSRLELSLPTGDGEAFAGAGGPILAPGLSFSVRHGRLFAAALQGARFRRAVEIGQQKVGTQIISSLGIGASVFADGHLDLGMEAHVFPVPGQPSRTLPDGARVVDSSLVPAEWLASARTRLGSVYLAVGAGTALPFSSETRRSPEGRTGTENFAGLTSPRFRAAFVLRYAPGSAR